MEIKPKRYKSVQTRESHLFFFKVLNKNCFTHDPHGDTKNPIRTQKNKKNSLWEILNCWLRKKEPPQVNILNVFLINFREPFARLPFLLFSMGGGGKRFESSATDYSYTLMRSMVPTSSRRKFCASRIHSYYSPSHRRHEASQVSNTRRTRQQ